MVESKIKVYLDEYNTLLPDGDPDNGVGDFINLIPIEKVEKEFSSQFLSEWKKQIIEVEEEDYKKYRESIKIVEELGTKFYKIYEGEDDKTIKN